MVGSPQMPLSVARGYADRSFMEWCIVVRSPIFIPPFAVYGPSSAWFYSWSDVSSFPLEWRLRNSTSPPFAPSSRLVCTKETKCLVTSKIVFCIVFPSTPYSTKHSILDSIPEMYCIENEMLQTRQSHDVREWFGFSFRLIFAEHFTNAGDVGWQLTASAWTRREWIQGETDGVGVDSVEDSFSFRLSPLEVYRDPYHARDTHTQCSSAWANSHAIYNAMMLRTHRTIRHFALVSSPTHHNVPPTNLAESLSTMCIRCNLRCDPHHSKHCKGNPHVVPYCSWLPLNWRWRMHHNMLSTDIVPMKKGKKG